MEMNRRNLLKLGAVSADATVASVTLSGCKEEDAAAPAAAPAAAAPAPKAELIGKHSVVVIGGGIGGLTVANNLKKTRKDTDILGH